MLPPPGSVALAWSVTAVLVQVSGFTAGMLTVGVLALPVTVAQAVAVQPCSYPPS
jgi:hypothetical protein